MRKTILSILIGFMSVSFGYAQEGWTLDECIEYARQHSPGILSTRSQIDIQKVQADSRYSFLIPSIQAQVGFYTLISSNSMQSFNYPYSYLFVNGLIYDWQQAANSDVLANTAQAMEYSLEQALHDLSVQVSTLFLQTMYMAEQENKMKEMLDTANFSTRLERLQIESNLADYQSQYINLRLTLAQLIGAPDPDQFNIAVPDDFNELSEKELEVPNPKLDNESVFSFPSVKAAQHNLKASESSLKVAKASKLPKLAWGIQTGSFYQNFFKPTDPETVLGLRDQLVNHFTFLPQAYLLIPIANQGSTKKAKNQARLSILTSQNMLDESKKALIVESEKSYAQTLAARAKYLAVLEKSRQENPVSPGTLSDLIYARYDYLIKRNILDYYLNK